MRRVEIRGRMFHGHLDPDPGRSGRVRESWEFFSWPPRVRTGTIFVRAGAGPGTSGASGFGRKYIFKNFCGAPVRKNAGMMVPSREIFPAARSDQVIGVRPDFFRTHFFTNDKVKEFVNAVKC